MTHRQNLAAMQGRAGDVAVATASFAELLDDMARVLGPDHPYALDTRNKLAIWRGQVANSAVDESTD